MGKTELQRLTQPTQDCRAAIAEAHGAAKDINKALAEHREYVRTEMDTRIQAELTRQLERVAEATSRAVAEINARFRPVGGHPAGSGRRGPHGGGSGPHGRRSRLRRQGQRTFGRLLRDAADKQIAHTEHPRSARDQRPVRDQAMTLRDRRLIPATCQLHRGSIGFTNLVVTYKPSGEIVFDIEPAPVLLGQRRVRHQQMHTARLQAHSAGNLAS